MKQYAGEQLTTGPQAKVYADYFIGNHLKEIGGGKTYAQLASESIANPTDTKLAATVQTMFQGNTLRGLLLTSSAFWQLGTIAGWAAIAAFAGAGLLVYWPCLVTSTAGESPRPKKSWPPGSRSPRWPEPGVEGQPRKYFPVPRA